MAEPPQASNIKGCDSQRTANDPAKTAGNPAECRTFEVPIAILERQRERLCASRGAAVASLDERRESLFEAWQAIVDYDRDIAEVDAAIASLRRDGIEQHYCPDLARLADDGGRA